LHAGDIITIRSTVLEIKDKVLQIFHEMRNDETGEVAATMKAVAIHIDMNARKARPIPEDIRSRAMSMLGEDVQSYSVSCASDPESRSRNFDSRSAN
jgi:acyl-CoA thioester hydrolase